MVHRGASGFWVDYRFRRRSLKRGRDCTVVAVSSESRSRGAGSHTGAGGRAMIARLQIGLAASIGLAITLLAGCSAHLPGQPNEAERWRAPAEITDFNQLYTQNCAGCHGVDGRLGAASSLNDPLYLAFVTDDAMRQAISKGRIGTNMPAFSEQAGGHLTDQQIELLVTGMRSRWSKPDEFKGVELPRYSVDETVLTSGPTRGAVAYKIYCGSCHGTNGDGGSAGSIVDPPSPFVPWQL